jgi:hypothetical protein
MGQQPHTEERTTRSPLRSWRSRITRYGFRALVVAGAAGAAWLLGSQTANAAQEHRAAESCRAGLLPAAVQTVDRIVPSRGDAPSGTSTCDGQPAPSRGDTAPPRHAAASTDASVANPAASATLPVAGPGAVEPGGPTTSDVASAPDRPVAADRAADAGPPDRPSTAGNTLGQLLPVAPLTAATSPITDQLTQSPVPAVLDVVSAPVTGALVDATRPVAGVLGTPDRPLPGVLGTALAPVTDVLTSKLHQLSGSTTAHPPTTALHPAPGRQGGSAAGASRALFRDRSGAPFATWTGRTDGSQLHNAGTSQVPALPGQAPFPVLPGPGFPNGGMSTGSAGHATGGVTAPVMSSAVCTDALASRVRPVTAILGRPRERVADPAVSPD